MLQQKVYFDHEHMFNQTLTNLLFLLFLFTFINNIAGKAPYSGVITHGFVLDEKGLKMSKSVGNVVDPRTIIEGGKNQEVSVCLWELIIVIILSGGLLFIYLFFPILSRKRLPMEQMYLDSGSQV